MGDRARMSGAWSIFGLCGECTGDSVNDNGLSIAQEGIISPACSDHSQVSARDSGEHVT